MDSPPLCAGCLFCENLEHSSVRCSNADLAQDGGWQEIYLVQGYLEFPPPPPNDQPCFWYVPKR